MKAYSLFSFPYLKRIVSAVNQLNVPCILFVKGGGHWLDLLRTSGASVLGMDWTVPLHQARNIVNDEVSLQGNLDPSILLAPNEVIKEEVVRVLEPYGNGFGHIFNLGHGITPDIPLEAVQTVVDTVRNESIKFKSSN